MPLVDIEALPGLVDPIPFWSARKLALARFKREDFLGDPAIPLADEVRRTIKEATGETQQGPIFLLANWRYFGFQINPIACYFCYDASGEHLEFLIAEVTNTPWDERHCYVLRASDSQGNVATEFAKAMHVSPFNPMDMTYQWRSSAPGDSLAIKLSNLQNGERIFDASLSLAAEPFTPGNLSRAVLSFPFMTFKVAAGIYWQALKLWLKGVPLIPHPKRV